MNDAELREQFAQWAAPLRAIPAPDFTRIRRQARRRNAGLAGTFAAALAVIGLAAGLLATSMTSAARPAWPAMWGAGTYPAPPGQPYVLLSSGSGPAVLRDEATGAVLKELDPGQGQFLAVAATPGDRQFVLAQASDDGQITFFELRIPVDQRGAGRAGAEVAGPDPVLRGADLPAGSQLNSMAINAAGTRLALAFSTPGSDNGSLGSLRVYDLQTSALIGSWQGQAANLSAPQFLGTGDTMAVDWPVSFTHRILSTQLRLVDTADAFPAGSSLLADSRSGAALRGAPGAFSQDGSITMNTVNGQVGLTTTPAGRVADLLEFDAASGRLVDRIPLGTPAAASSSSFCGVLWASANGRDLLTQCGARQLAITDGKATPVRLAWTFPVSLSLQAAPFAW